MSPIKILKWALRFTAVLLRTPFIDFEIGTPDIIKAIADIIKDGKLSDEDLAFILERIAEQL